MAQQDTSLPVSPSGLIGRAIAGSVRFSGRLSCAAANVGLLVYFSWAQGGRVFTVQGVVNQWVTCLKSSAATSSSDDPQNHLILATQRRLPGFFWTLLSLLNLRFQMLF